MVTGELIAGINTALPIDPDLVEILRVKVKTHIDNKNSLFGLDIERNKPLHGMLFQFIHATPSLPDTAKVDRTLWYRCSYCERDRKFQNGSIVYCSDKKLRLIGATCWEHHVDKETYNAAKEDFRIYLRRLKFKELKERYVPALEKLWGSLKRNRNDIAIQSAFFDDFPMSFRKKFPELVYALDKSLKNNRALTVERLFKLPAGGHEWRIETIYQFKGEGALTEHNAILPVWDKAFKAASNAEHHFKNVDWDILSNKKFEREISKFREYCSEAISAATEVDSRIATIISFISANNMQGIAKWANHSDCDLRLNTNDGVYEAIIGGLRYIPSQQQPIEIALSKNYSSIQFDGVSELKALMDRV